MNSMKKEGYFDSKGKGRIYYCSWEPQERPKAIVQLVHGIAEHVKRYDAFASFLAEKGFLVVAEDHMGHGNSLTKDGIRGYFNGGWFAAVDDTYFLLQQTKAQFPDVPYILFGHSMGSFMARTILEKYPDSGIKGCVISGTGWMPEAVLKAGSAISEAVCKISGETKPSQFLQSLVFGGYNKRVEHPKTPHDWLSRDTKIVDAYANDPLCGFIPAAGLIRDMLGGILYIQKKDNLRKMDRQLPVCFVSGGEDPVGNYGDGVLKSADKFKKIGMEHITTKIYPLCRHEVLNEINRNEVYQDLLTWMESVL